MLEGMAEVTSQKKKKKQWICIVDHSRFIGELILISCQQNFWWMHLSLVMLEYVSANRDHDDKPAKSNFRLASNPTDLDDKPANP